MGTTNTLQDATDLQARIGLIDLHVDTILQRRLFGYRLRKRHPALLPGQPLFWHADIPRMREAGYGGACLGIHYWPWESRRAVPEMERQIDILDRVAEEDPGCCRVRQPEDWERAREQGLLGLAPGVEGAHQLGGELSNVEVLEERRVAYLTLTHFSKNSFATPAMGRGSNDRDGLTPLGRQLVQELNRRGIVCDLSHLNMPGVIDVCRHTRAPVLATHSGARGVREHPRLLSDEAIDAIASVDGAAGVMVGSGFLSGRLRGGTTEDLLDHVEYLIERVGLRHLAFGSDYDGWLPRILTDHRDCRDSARITRGLLGRGYSEDEVAALLRDNALRVFRAAWEEREA